MVEEVKVAKIGVPSQSVTISFGLRLATGAIVGFVCIITVLVIIIGSLLLGVSGRGAAGLSDLIGDLANPSLASTKRFIFMASWGFVGGYFSGFLIGLPQKKHGPIQTSSKGSGKWVLILGLACCIVLAAAISQITDPRVYSDSRYSTAIGCILGGIFFGAVGWFWFLDRIGRGP
jgi:hypothetical protein